MSENPFQAPQVTPTQNMEGTAPVVKKVPVSITVFGVLNIVFGVIGICASGGAVFQLVMESSMSTPNPVSELIYQHPFFGPFQKISLGLGSVVSMLLLVGGILLLMNRGMGRTLSNAYGLCTIVMALVGVVMLLVFWSELLEIPGQSGMPIGMIAFWTGLVGNLLNMIYPVLLLIFINRPHVKAALR